MKKNYNDSYKNINTNTCIKMVKLKKEVSDNNNNLCYYNDIKMCIIRFYIQMLNLKK